MAREEYIPSQDDLDDLDDMDYHFARMSYELQPFTVRCSSCGDTDKDSQMNLERKGWELNSTQEICFRCSDRTEYRRAA